MKGNVSFMDVTCDDIDEQVETLPGGKSSTIAVAPVQQHRYNSDCGAFSISFAMHLLFTQDPRDRS